MSTSSSRRSMVMVSASPLSSSSSLHRSRGLSAKATATAAEGGDGGGDADAGGALTVMGRIIDTELKDEAEKSYIAERVWMIQLLQRWVVPERLSFTLV